MGKTITDFRLPVPRLQAAPAVLCSHFPGAARGSQRTAAQAQIIAPQGAGLAPAGNCAG